jgi:hypothetical protein
MENVLTRFSLKTYTIYELSKTRLLKAKKAAILSRFGYIRNPRFLER